MDSLRDRYKHYLQSDDWKEKRAAKLRKHRRCQICRSKEQLDVHHLNYRRWIDVLQSDLRVLCRRCHGIAHRLMDEGVLVYRSADHASRWEATKRAVLSVIRGPRPERTRVKKTTFAKPGSEIVITSTLIARMQTQHGGWTRDTLRLLGVSWPPPKKWKKQIVGRVLPLAACRLLVPHAAPQVSDDQKSLSWLNRI
jgi:hypothetical protein